MFERLADTIERHKLRLVRSPFWSKVGLCPPEYDKRECIRWVVRLRDFMFEEKGDYFRIRVRLNVQKPL